MSEIKRGTSTSGRDWARMTIMIDIPGYQGSISKLSFQVGTDRISDVQEFKVGDKVEIGWSIYAREYNGRWYNNVDLVNIKSQDQQQEQRPAPRQKASSKYEVCQNFCKERNCDFRLGTHSACARAISISGYNACPQTNNIPAGELDPAAHKDDLPW